MSGVGYRKCRASELKSSSASALKSARCRGEGEKCPVSGVKTVRYRVRKIFGNGAESVWHRAEMRPSSTLKVSGIGDE